MVTTKNAVPGGEYFQNVYSTCSMSYIIYDNMKISLFLYAMNNIRRFHLHLQ